jgi:hypothetical protein
MAAIVGGFDELPAPPAGVAALVSRLRSAIGEAGKQDFVGSCRADPMSSPCASALAGATSALRRIEMDSVLVAWKPYTH